MSNQHLHGHDLPALWGGIECTINRIGDRFHCQLERNGHVARLDDLERIAELGVQAVRYPVLWEQVAPEGPEKADWHWPDRRLPRLRALGITPIVGLVHHGSGPRDTSLVSDDFAPRLAAYAGAVARRYPWIDHYTPVNEPLTTARFSALYGIWYPHAREPAQFWRALVNQCRATVLAMRAIREVNPQAKLVATDDLGRFHSTPALAAQAAFNNDFRWLGWDLLFGRVDRLHPLSHWLVTACGASEETLAWFRDNACPPDILGANHYVTSERFLDERIDRYPPCYHGGNGRQRYADIETARCLAAPLPGIAPLLHEAWERYRTPIAITEVHIDSTRDDQMRWLAEVWNAATQVRAEGVDLRAVTVWALFGSFDWNSVLTRFPGYYESGAFDIRGGRPRPTALATMMRTLSRGRPLEHPVLAQPGWWRRDGRHFCEPVPGSEIAPVAGVRVEAGPRDGNAGVARAALSAARHTVDGAGTVTARPILVTGATGTLGQALSRICTARGLQHVLLDRAALDIGDAGAIERAFDRHRPWAVINAAGYVRVDAAEHDAERCLRDNAQGPALLAASCARHRLPLLTFSSDLVFDGRKRDPYLEDDPVAPLGVYGRSKARGEALVLDRHPESLVVRTSAFFGPWDRHNFVSAALHALAAGRPFAAATDQVVSPTYVPDLVQACLDLLVDGEAGIWHISSGEAMSWEALARRAAAAARIDVVGLRGCTGRELGQLAVRPAFSALGSTRAAGLMPSLSDALVRCIACPDTMLPRQRTADTACEGAGALPGRA